MQGQMTDINILEEEEEDEGELPPCAGRERMGDQQPPMMMVFIGFLVALCLAVIIRMGRSNGGICLYHHAYRRSTCKTKNLIDIPSEIPNGIEVLILGTDQDKDDNLFDKLGPDNFTRFTHLQDLVLVHCGIRKLMSETFSSLLHLKLLDLSHNEITEIRGDIFSGIIHLDLLKLSHNPILSIPDSTFDGLSLRQLVFVNNTKLSHISNKAFLNAKVGGIVISRASLKSLSPHQWSLSSEYLREVTVVENLFQPLDIPEDAFESYNLSRLVLCRNGILKTTFLNAGTYGVVVMDGNPIESIDIREDVIHNETKILSLGNAKLTQSSFKQFRKFPRLEILNVSINRLTELNATVLADMPSLVLLDASKNEISRFAGNLTGVLSQLETLLLHGNKLETIPNSLEPIFQRLVTVSICDNSLHCNCELEWLKSWLKSSAGRKHLRESAYSIHCYNDGRPSVLIETELKCRKPTIQNITLGYNQPSLICRAEGDPPPHIIWTRRPILSNTVSLGEKLNKDLVENQPEKFFQELIYSITEPEEGLRSSFVTSGTLLLTEKGNFTCLAKNLAGEDRRNFDSDTMKTTVADFVTFQRRKLEILSTTPGLAITLCMLIGLGYIFKHQ